MGSYNNISLRKGPHDVQTVHCITAGAFLEVNQVPRFLVRFFSEFLATFRSMDVFERSGVLSRCFPSIFPSRDAREKRVLSIIQLSLSFPITDKE